VLATHLLHGSMDRPLPSPVMPSPNMRAMVTMNQAVGKFTVEHLAGQHLVNSAFCIVGRARASPPGAALRSSWLDPGPGWRAVALGAAALYDHRA